MNDDKDWESGFAKSVGLYLNGAAIPTPDAHGHTIVDSAFLACFNAYWEPIEWRLPDAAWAEEWRPVLDSSSGFHDEADAVKAGETYTVAAPRHRALRTHHGELGQLPRCSLLLYVRPAAYSMQRNGVSWG